MEITVDTPNILKERRATYGGLTM